MASMRDSIIRKPAETKPPVEALRETLSKKDQVMACVEKLDRQLIWMRRVFIDTHGKDVTNKYQFAIDASDIGKFADLVITELTVRRLERKFREKGRLDPEVKCTLDVATGYRDITEKNAGALVRNAVTDFLKENAGISLGGDVRIIPEDSKAIKAISDEFLAHMTIE